MKIRLCRVCANPFAIVDGGDPAYAITPDAETGFTGDRCPQCLQLATLRISRAAIARAKAAIALELLRLKDG